MLLHSRVSISVSLSKEISNEKIALKNYRLPHHRMGQINPISHIYMDNNAVIGIKNLSPIIGLLNNLIGESMILSPSVSKTNSKNRENRSQAAKEAHDAAY